MCLLAVERVCCCVRLCWCCVRCVELCLAGVFGPLGNERYVDYMRDIHASGQHLLELINDILDVSAIEAGKLVLRPEV